MVDVYLVGVDQGTTSTRAILFDEKLNVLRVSRRKFRQIYPKEGWVEHDPEEIWKTVLKTVDEVIEGVDVKEIAALGLTNQRETTIAWDSETGEVLYNAIVWQCRRTAERAEELRRSHGKTIHEKTGLVADPYFSATKMEWMIENVDSVKESLERGTLRFGTVDSFLAWRMTGEHVTDVSNASRTMLFNLRELDWDDDLLDLFGVPRWALPRVVPNSGIIGRTGWGFPLSGMVGDQQGALFGQAAFSKGETKVTMGTGSFLLTNTGEDPVFSKRGLLTTVGWRTKETVYALEGSVFITGALIDWFVNVGMFESPEEISRLAEKSDNGGVYIVPALTGLGAPHWDPYARGLIIGLTRATSRENLARAILESIVFSIKELLEIVEEEMGSDIPVLKVDGGVSKSNALLEVLSKATGKRIERPENMETTATGAVMLAGIGVGLFDEEALKNLREVELEMENEKGLEREFERWREAVKRSLNWAR